MVTGVNNFPGMKKALVTGASGFVGRYLTDLLLASPDYEKVTIVVRRDTGLDHPKLKTLIADFESLPQMKEAIEADEVFITLGTTRKKTPDLKDYYQIDHDYPVLATQIAKEIGAGSVFLLTAVGADAGSRTFYLRTKGETERDVIAVGMDHTHIFRPSMILGERTEFRLLEKIALKIWPLAEGLLQLFGLSKYRGISGKDIAKAMINAASQNSGKVEIYEWKRMRELAG